MWKPIAKPFNIEMQILLANVCRFLLGKFPKNILGSHVSVSKMHADGIFRLNPNLEVLEHCLTIDKLINQSVIGSWGTNRPLEEENLKVLLRRWFADQGKKRSWF
jgi:hypothetical protein